MKKPTVDYSGFRLSRIREPRFRHLMLLPTWIAYFILYFLLEHIYPQSDYYPVYCKWDDLFPFQEIFVIPYVSWYVLLAGSLVYFLFYDVKAFKQLQIYLLIMQVVALLIYTFWPTRLDLQPTQFPRDNFCTDIVKLLYAVDNCTNACPSLHVGFSLAITSVWLHRKQSRWGTKVFMVAMCVIICLSTVYIKQHSVVDFFGALPLALLSEVIVFTVPWLRNRKKMVVS